MNVTNGILCLILAAILSNYQGDSDADKRLLAILTFGSVGAACVFFVRALLF